MVLPEMVFIPVVPAQYIPYTRLVAAPPVTTMGPLPLVVPIVFPVIVPMLILPVAVVGILIAVQADAPASPQVKFLMVLPCTLVVVPTVGPTFRLIALNVLVNAFVFVQLVTLPVVPQLGALPPIKFPLMVISVEVRTETLIGV